MTDEPDRLVALARGARARIAAPAGAAVVDDIGRIYSGAAVDLPHLQLAALELAVAQAAAAGAERLTAAVVVGAGSGGEAAFGDLAAPGAQVVQVAR